MTAPNFCLNDLRTPQSWACSQRTAPRKKYTAAMRRTASRNKIYKQCDAPRNELNSNATCRAMNQSADAPRNATNSRCSAQRNKQQRQATKTKKNSRCVTPQKRLFVAQFCLMDPKSENYVCFTEFPDWT